jgi:hypothetical protein
MSRLFSFTYEVRERNKSFLSDSEMATEASRNPETGQVPVPRVQEVRANAGSEGSPSYKASGRLSGISF